VKIFNGYDQADVNFLWKKLGSKGMLKI
jgi:hypothetical protein